MDRTTASLPTDLVLVPGLNNTAAVWDTMRPLLPAGVRVHTPEVPALDDIDAIAASMLAGLPERFALLGFSFGGYVALAMLATAPQRITALAMVGTSASADGEAARANRLASIARAQAGEYEAMIEAQATRALGAASQANPAIVSARRAMVRDYGPQRFIAHVRATLGRPDRSALFAAFTGPVLVTGGADDQVITPTVQRGLAALHPRARFAPIADAGHLVPMEQPAELARVLSEWLIEL